MMYFIKKTYKNTLNIERSEFIALLFEFNAQNEREDILKNIKKEYPNATHYCSAYVLGDNGQYASSNDDGEPSGTAGFPILDVLRKNELTNVLCIVVRYFGGIKLGAGGLIRAYSSSASSVVNIASRYIKQPLFHYQLTFDYNLIDKINILIDDLQIFDKTYLDKVTYDVNLYTNDLSFLDEFKHLIKITFIKEHFDFMLIEQ